MSSVIESVLYEYNPWWDGRLDFQPTIIRSAVLARLIPLLHTRDVVLITGIRRVGKTVAMKQLIEHLITQDQVEPTRCLYVSLDDYQLRNKTLIDIVSTFRKMMKVSIREPVYVFFDEVTSVPDYAIQLKNFYDKGVMHCMASSSSSALLRDERAHLTGRNRVIEINPLNFLEYCLFKNIEVDLGEPDLMCGHFETYMQVGGMPEYVLAGEREYLTTLIDNIISKDIIARHHLRNGQVVREFFMLLMERAGKQISLNKVANILKLSVDTAKRYLYLFEECYLIHLVPRYGSTNETILSPKKIYATDLGMRQILMGFRDKGAIFENIVFMLLKDQRPCYVLTEGQEIDFYFNQTLVEVKYQRQLVDKQLSAFKAFPAERKIVITGIMDLLRLTDGTMDFSKVIT